MNSENDRAKLRAVDVCVGCIVWLPKESPKIPLRCIKTSHNDILKGGYNHPAVILRLKQDETSQELGDLIATIASVTSNPRFGTSTCRIINRHPDDISSAIEHASPALRLEGDMSLYKQSYVLLDHIYDAPLSMLRSFSFTGFGLRAYQRRLDEDSYGILATLLGLEPEDYPPTMKLWETAAVRLERLADPNVVQEGVEGLTSQYRGSQQQVSTILEDSEALQRPLLNSYAEHHPIRERITSITSTLRYQRGFWVFVVMGILVFWLLVIYVCWRINRALSHSG